MVLSQNLTPTAVGGFQQGQKLAQQGLERNALSQIAGAINTGDFATAGAEAAKIGDIDLVNEIKGLRQQGKQAEIDQIKAKSAAMKETLSIAEIAHTQNPESFGQVAQALGQRFMQDHPDLGFTLEQVVGTLNDPAKRQAALVEVQGIDGALDQDKRDFEREKFEETKRSNLAREGSAGSVKPAGQTEFEALTAGLSPSEKEKAVRVKLGLDPRSVGAAQKTFDVGGVPHIFDPVSGEAIPVTVRGKEVTAETVSESEAMIAAEKERAKGSVVLSNKAIDSGYAAIGKINGNIRNIDRALDALARGAKTGAVQRFLPNIRAASVELAQIQKELGLDVIGAVTFGALSKGELDLALTTALPTGLNEAELADFMRRKKLAQEKLRDYFDDQISFLADGNTVVQWRQRQRGDDTQGLPEGFVLD